MKANHTPGQWNQGTVESNESRYYQPFFSERGRCLGVIYGDQGLRWTDTDRLNVRVIISSPDLLAVARLVVESQGWDGNDPDNDRWKELYAKARAAVNRATAI